MLDDRRVAVELEGYEELEALGESAAAMLLRAREPGSGTSVVIKLLKSEHPTPEEVSRLAHEHRIVESLQLDGIVRPLRIERFKHRVGLILEDSGGSSLRSMIGPTGLDAETFLRVSIPLVKTLGHIHDADVIHKDLNPSNIVVDDTLSKVQITDFGIASRLPRVYRDAGPADRLEGTLPYLSPEQTGRMNRAIDHRSDFYSLGATFYEALTGRPPFAADDAMEMVHCHLAVRPVPPLEVNPSVPEALSDIVVKLLAKSAEDRYQSAYGLLRDLEVCQAAWRDGQRIDAFPLGLHDVSSRFNIPDRLYGREAETAELLASLDRAANGKTELLLLVGGSGTGKSVLVQELERPTVERRGFFIRGKFDQYSASAPYASLIDAVKELVHQLLGEPPDRVAAWRDAILPDWPAMRRWSATSSPTSPGSPGPSHPSQNWGRRKRRTASTSCSGGSSGRSPAPEQPLVIFLDDLHWADAASIRLLRTLVSDPEARNLLIVGAYRPEAVDPSGPLAAAIAALDPSSVRRIELGALDLATVTRPGGRHGPGGPGGRHSPRRARSPTDGREPILRPSVPALPVRGRAAPLRRRQRPVELGPGRDPGPGYDRQRRRTPRRTGCANFGRGTQEALRTAAVIGNTFDLATLARALDVSLGRTAGRLDGGDPSRVPAPTRRRSRTHRRRLRGSRTRSRHLPLLP